MLGGADNPNGELPSYITGADSGIRGKTDRFVIKAMLAEPAGIK